MHTEVEGGRGEETGANNLYSYCLYVEIIDRLSVSCTKGYHVRIGSIGVLVQFIDAVCKVCKIGIRLFKVIAN